VQNQRSSPGLADDQTTLFDFLVDEGTAEAGKLSEFSDSVSEFLIVDCHQYTSPTPYGRERCKLWRFGRQKRIVQI